MSRLRAEIIDTHEQMTWPSRSRRRTLSESTPKALATEHKYRYNQDETNNNLYHIQKWCEKRPNLPILKPDRPFLIIWNVFIIIILIWALVEIPYIIAFQITPKINSWFVFGLLIDMCLVFDIFINFRTAYIDKFDRLRVIENPKLIARRYFKTWFLVDFVSSFPFSFLVFLSVGDEDSAALMTFEWLRLFRALKLLRIIKLFKMYNIFHEVSQNYEMTRVQTSILRLIKVIACMLLTAHFFACIWYSIGYYTHKAGHSSWIDVLIANDDYDKGVFVRYSYAFYWAIVTLFTTGYGDISANNIYEQWAASIAIMFGSCIFAYFIGVLTTELTEDLKHQHDAERIEKSMAFCTYYNLPRQIRRAVMIHANYFNNANYPFDPSFVMNSLPNYLQKDIERFLRHKRLRDLDIFKFLPDTVVGQIALKLKTKSCGANKQLYSRDDIGKTIFIQRTGESVLVSDEKFLRKFKRGDVIGENVIISRKRKHSVRCQTYSEFYVLDIMDIVDVLKEHYKASEAKNQWLTIKRIIRSPVSLDNAIDAAQQQRHVHLETIKNLEELYVPRLAKDQSTHAMDALSPSDERSDSQQHDAYEIYEDQLLEEEEKEAADKGRQQKNKSMRHIMSMFQTPIRRESSDFRRDEEIRKHHKKKFNKSADFGYKPDKMPDIQDMQQMMSYDDHKAMEESDGSDEWIYFVRRDDNMGSTKLKKRFGESGNIEDHEDEQMEDGPVENMIDDQKQSDENHVIQFNGHEIDDEGEADLKKDREDSFFDEAEDKVLRTPLMQKRLSVVKDGEERE